ncbi:MAG: hypothetical protein ACTSUP_08105 [Candidatus Heimdallarchaeaceae archaeon]
MTTELIHPDVIEPWRIIRHFRDLNNLASLLDYDKEVSRFVKRLKEIGWAGKKIQEFQNAGASGTRFEQSIPHVLPSKGDRIEYFRNKGRMK